MDLVPCHFDVAIWTLSSASERARAVRRQYGVDEPGYRDAAMNDPTNMGNEHVATGDAGLTHETSELEATAFHEAGHAVIANYLRLATPAITIVPDDNALGMATHPSFPNIRPDVEVDGRTRHLIENRIMTLWAGTLAEEIHTGHENVAGSDYDQRLITDLGLYVAPNDEELAAFTQWLRFRARSLLWHPLVWRLVEAVAARVLADQTLSAAQVRQTISDASPRFPIGNRHDDQSKRDEASGVPAQGGG